MGSNKSKTNPNKPNLFAFSDNSIIFKKPSNFYDEIIFEFHKYFKSDQSSSKVIWQYYSSYPFEEKWSDYSEYINLQIETAFQQYEDFIKINIQGSNHEINLKEMQQVDDNDVSIKIRRKEDFNGKLEEYEYQWFWQNNKNPFSNETPIWAPYDIFISNYIERCYLEGKNRLEVEMNSVCYIIDIKSNKQYNKSNSYLQRPIRRASNEESIKISRDNRFISDINSHSSKYNLLTNYDNKENIQTRIKVSYIIPDDELIKDILDIEVCLPENIINELKNYMRDKHECVIKILSNEIMEQANLLSSLKQDNFLVSTINYKFQALSLLKTLCKDGNVLMENIIKIYTEESFLVYNINEVLRSGQFTTSLKLYFFLLQSSLAFAGRKYNNVYSKDLYRGNRLNFFRAAKLKRDIIDQDMINSEKGMGRFIVFNEFLSTSYSESIAKEFLFRGDLELGLERVLYQMNVHENEFVNNPNILSFIEDISRFKREKEVLFSASTIFRITNVMKIESYYKIDLDFISNGYNKYDFIMYYTLTNIDLSNNNIGIEGTKYIANILEKNSILTNIDLSKNIIGVEGTKYIANVLKKNFSLINIDLSRNYLGVKGAKYISNVLENNSSLTNINLSFNNIGVEGAKHIANVFKKNSTLIYINLIENNLTDEGAKVIADALNKNYTLTHIDLSLNKIGVEGAKHISYLLKKNSTLNYIELRENDIGKDGVKYIAFVLDKNYSLTNINLSWNFMGDDGAKYIAYLLENNSTLTNIYLSWNKIGDDGVKLIANALKKNSTLTFIDLCLNNIGAEGVKYISEVLKNNSTLTYIDLLGNNIGAEGEKYIANAKKKNPKIKIKYSII